MTEPNMMLSVDGESGEGSQVVHKVGWLQGSQCAGGRHGNTPSSYTSAPTILLLALSG